MSYRLTKQQVHEYKILTQFANRRIIKAHEDYAREGLQLVPRELVGKTRMRDDWYTDKTPLSSAVTGFESKKEYQERLAYLRRFRHTAPSVYEYANTQSQMTLKAMMTSIGDLSPELEEKINSMTAPQIDKFWKSFTEKSVRLGHLYSSESAAAAAIQEVFEEDMTHLLQSSLR